MFEPNVKPEYAETQYSSDEGEPWEEEEPYEDSLPKAPPKDSSEQSKQWEDPLQEPPKEDEELDHEELNIADTYATYEPLKVKLGSNHPDQVVESASLASVEPPDVWYELSMPDVFINSGSLSGLQLESIVYACQQHECRLPDGSRGGFLIGDGTGVGKGRTVAGIIWENYLKGRKKAVWVSVSNDLKFDCERDLKDIGANIKVHSLNKMKYTPINSIQNGSVQSGVVYCTYASLIGKTSASVFKFKTRLDQILQWCGKDFDGLIIFDEAHRAKNLLPGNARKSTKTGLVVLELQKQLPQARIVYVSATGASEPRNMAYMTRLGMWGAGSPFPEFMDFLRAVEKRGVGAMEIVALDLKMRGMYIARQLSFSGVTFRIEEVPLDADFIQMYNDSVDLWIEIWEEFNEAAKAFDDIEEEINPVTGKKKNKRRTMWSQFWSAHQRFFKYLCIASKVKHSVELAKAAVNDGHCVVLGLLSTGEARTLDELERVDEEELSDFISTAKGVLRNLVEKHYPTEDPSNENHKKTSWNKDDESEIDESSDCSDETDSDERLWEGRTPKSTKRKRKTKWSSKYKKTDKQTKKKVPKDKNQPGRRVENPIVEDLLKKIDDLGERLPPNTLDQLVDELGGPDNVAEMTGRKGRIVRSKGLGYVEYESRAGVDAPLETLNLIEKEKFMNGEKKIAIISEAASMGISLHSDRRVLNQRKRVHITLELPWSADRAMQQFGRTHRSNQVNAPEYVFLISDLAGERRFASIIAKRLESLGALTHGDRRATETRDMSRFNIYNKYGTSALSETINSFMGTIRAVLPPPEDYEGDFFEDVTRALISVGYLKPKDDEEDELANQDVIVNDLTKFLNRILGVKVDLQNRIFKYFSDILQVNITRAKKEGRYDLGILDMGSTGEVVTRVKSFTFLRKHTTGKATVRLEEFQVERGMSWEKAVAKYSELSNPEEGFYTNRIRGGSQRSTAVLAVYSPIGRPGDGSNDRDTYLIYRPNIGLQSQKLSLADVKIRFKKVDASVAEPLWTQQFNESEFTCSHIYMWRGYCKTAEAGLRCEYGLRKCSYNVLSGSILEIWTRLEKILGPQTKKPKLQIVRMKTEDNYRTIGLVIPPSIARRLRDDLAKDSEKTFEEKF